MEIHQGMEVAEQGIRPWDGEAFGNWNSEEIVKLKEIFGEMRNVLIFLFKVTEWHAAGRQLDYRRIRLGMNTSGFEFLCDQAATRK